MKSIWDDLPKGIRRERGRGFIVEVHLRPFPKRRKRFPLGTPVATMRAWREVQHAELMLARHDARVPVVSPDVLRDHARDLDLLANRVIKALAEIAIMLEQSSRTQARMSHETHS